MTVLIQGMDMPEVCSECPVFKLEYDPTTGLTERHCGVTGLFISRTTAAIDRRDNCPIKDVPVPHGPLGDLDQMRTTESKRYKKILANVQSKEEAVMHAFIHRKVQDVIDDAEMVIPPEEYYECD